MKLQVGDWVAYTSVYGHCIGRVEHELRSREPWDYQVSPGPEAGNIRHDHYLVRCEDIAATLRTRHDLAPYFASPDRRIRELALRASKGLP